jgi:hypothetical protein
MTRFTVRTARSWLVQSGCEPEEVESGLYFFLLGLADDRQCDLLHDCGCDDVPITSEEVQLLRGEIVMQTLANRFADIQVGIYLLTGPVRAWTWMRSPPRSTKRERLHHFRHGRMTTRHEPERKTGRPGSPTC